MFSSAGLFKRMSCPIGEQCKLTNCVFSHDATKNAVKQDLVDHVPLARGQSDATASTSNGSDAKRRKLENCDKVTTKEAPQEQLANGQKATSSPSSTRTSAKSSSAATRVETPSQESPQRSKSSSLRTISKPVSPPPSSTRAKAAAPATADKSHKQRSESLNPRLLQNDPAGHGKRTLYLKALHKELERLNELVKNSTDQAINGLQLNDDELIKMALNEEEKFAREQASVYANVIKLQIVKYRKMGIDQWVEQRRKTQMESSRRKTEGIDLITGLNSSEEVTMLRRMIVKHDGLARWGYVTSPPTDDEIKAARDGIEASGGYEECDRCRTRFQVFPDRREDGSLTSGGACTYHWGKPFTPKREKIDAVRGAKEPRYSCCHEAVGSRGCTEASTHVFKISEAKRLAAVLPYEETPETTKTPFEAICFDCEMGYTTQGLELIRLTAISWPGGHALLDVLVRPIGAVLDLNSRFSGVFPEHLTTAQPLDIDSWEKQVASFQHEKPSGEDLAAEHQQLRIVSSPAVARSLLLKLINQQSLVVGHALENDLNAVRLIHPKIVDTVFLFPHPRGMPIRYGLRQLASQYLERHIQQAGSAGHSSLEDARATADVARYKVMKEWERLRLDGWTVRDGEFFAPGEEKARVEELEIDPGKGTKRKHPDSPGR